MARHGFAGEGCGIELCAAVEDDAVDGHALARLDHDGAADADVVRKDLLELAVCAFDVGVIGSDIHHGADGFAAFAYSVGLEELADLVKQHDCGALGRAGLGVGEEDGRKGADGRDGHKEVLIEDLTALDVVECLVEDIVTGDQEGDQVEDESDVFAAPSAER